MNTVIGYRNVSLGPGPDCSVVIVTPGFSAVEVDHDVAIALRQVAAKHGITVSEVLRRVTELIKQ